MIKASVLYPSVTALGPSAETILGDLPNYTDIAPVVQISEVKVL